MIYAVFVYLSIVPIIKVLKAIANKSRWFWYVRQLIIGAKIRK